MAASYVLVVDDDPAIRGLVSDALRSEGYTVDLAAHGREALEAMRARRPATVVLDLMMPVMDGWEFLAQCRRRLPCASVPVAIMTAAQDAALAASKLGVQGYLTKPFELEAVLAVVDRLATGEGVN